MMKIGLIVVGWDLIEDRNILSLNQRLGRIKGKLESAIYFRRDIYTNKYKYMRRPIIGYGVILLYNNFNLKFILLLAAKKCLEHYNKIRYYTYSDNWFIYKKYKTRMYWRDIIRRIREGNNYSLAQILLLSCRDEGNESCE